MTNELKIPEAYELINVTDLNDIASAGYLLKHRKTGARVAIVANDDINKCFSIAFRTPPKDSTGVAHIIEHTVLCGSDKYPVKDPFVELAKGSLNTFLNAITFPDKTMYPVASCNDKDFRNLMDVYLDAVFHPNIYKTELIFRQEGWHYHLEDMDAPLTYNGVVYNEMKGAFSSADELLDRTVFSALFPDTPYGVESGGDPDCIPDLTYEDYLDFHRKYYHPSNSYIYLYGRQDFYDRLDYIDKEYLSRYDHLDVDSEIAVQAPFEEKKEIELDYPVLEDEPLEENTYFNVSTVVADADDLLKNMAFTVLEYVLLDAPGAPVKQALLDAGVGKDVTGSFQDGLKQNFFTIETKFASEDDRDRFIEVINGTLEKLVSEGLDEKALRAAIHYFEFRFREGDYGSFPKGLIYGMNMMDTWLYDDNKPFAYLNRLSVYDELKKRIGTGYYEGLIKDFLLDNPHSVVVTMNPKRGLLEEKEALLAEKLAAVKASLSEEETEQLVAETERLAAFQAEPDSDEDMAKLPMLKIDDIDKKTPIELRTKELCAGGVKILQHDFDTNGIGYLTVLFDISDVSSELVPSLSLLKSMLAYVSTENFSYGELFNEINSRTGGINCGLHIMPLAGGSDKRFFGIKAKYLYEEQDFIFDMIKEILLRSRFDDDRRMYDIIAGQKSQFQENLSAAGHITGIQRAMAGSSAGNCFQEQISGVTYYRFLEELFADYEGNKDKLKSDFRLLLNHIFRKEKMIIDITASDEAMEDLKKNAQSLAAALYTGEAGEMSYEFVPGSAKEAFKTNGQVQYVTTAGNFIRKGYEYNGAMKVLGTILNYGYLWSLIRVQGGAYGCFSSFKRNGDAYLASYRDPHLEQTLDVYRKLPEFLESFSADEEEMTKYIIGTIGPLDAPRNASANGSLSFNSYITGLTEEDFQKDRDQILSCSEDVIRSFASMARDTFDMERMCVVGSGNSINKHEELFDTTENLVNA